MSGLTLTKMMVGSPFSEELLLEITRAGLFHPDGGFVDCFEEGFDQNAGWFRAHPSLPYLIEKFAPHLLNKTVEDDLVYLYDKSNRNVIKYELIPICLIPFSKVIYCRGSDDDVYDEWFTVSINIAKAISTVTLEELSRKIDSHLCYADQLRLEKQKQAKVIEKISEINTANVLFSMRDKFDQDKFYSY